MRHAHSLTILKVVCSLPGQWVSFRLPDLDLQHIAFEKHKTLFSDAKREIQVVRRLIQPNDDGTTFRRYVMMAESPSRHDHITVFIYVNLESRSSNVRTGCADKEGFRVCRCPQGELPSQFGRLLFRKGN